MNIRQLNEELDKFLEEDKSKLKWEYYFEDDHTFFEKCIVGFLRIVPSLYPASRIVVELGIPRKSIFKSKFGHQIAKVNVSEIGAEMIDIGLKDNNSNTLAEEITICNEILETVSYLYGDRKDIPFNPPKDLLNLLLND